MKGLPNLQQGWLGTTPRLLRVCLIIGLCVPGDAGLGHGPTSQGRREQESESNTPAGLASRRGEALLLTRSYGGVGAVLGPYSEERAYSNRSSSSEYYNRS